MYLTPRSTKNFPARLTHQLARIALLAVDNNLSARADFVEGLLAGECMQHLDRHGKGG